MIREITKTKLMCDACHSEDNVRSYYFNRKTTDSHGNNYYDEVSIELCEKCQDKVYNILYDMIFVKDSI